MAALAVATATVGLAAPSALASPAAGTERLTVLIRSGPSGDTSQVIATGPVTGVGTLTFAHVEGQEAVGATVELPQGTLSVLSTQLTDNSNPNFTSCVNRFSGTSALRVIGGTGAFAGATGTGTGTDQGFAVAARNADGTCNLDAEPLAGFEIVHVTLNLT